MTNKQIQKASLMGLSAACIAGGLELAQSNVWAGVVVVIAGIGFAYLREYLKEIDNKK